MAKGSLVLLGSGPGIGVRTAALFASKGFTSIALLARSAERLPQDAATVSKANPSAKVKTFAVDIADIDKLKATLAQVEKECGPPEVVIYNAARVVEQELGKEPPESVLNDFKIAGLGTYIAMVWAQPHLVKLAADDRSAHPSFFLSGSSLGKNAWAPFFSLAMQKAAQHSLMQSFNNTVGAKGVHVADVLIEGPVADENPVVNAANVAKAHWDLYQESPKDWRWEVEVGKFPLFKPAKPE